jgi:SAM-dependent methyltransferase
VRADSAEFRAHRNRELTERARAHWTPPRLAELARGKALLLPPIEAAPLLRTIGLLHRDASMPPRQVRKYWQVSHMVTLLGAALRGLLDAHGVVRIVDAGCGRSYLSLALAWVAEHRWGGRVQVLGVDRNPDVIEECRRRARFAQLDHALRFRAEELGHLDPSTAWREAFADEPNAPRSASPVATADGPADAAGPWGPLRPAFDAADAPAVHALLSLHACDTATCDALALAVRLGAPLVAVAPCCQAELARGWAALAGNDPALVAPGLRAEESFASQARLDRRALRGTSSSPAPDEPASQAPNPFRAIWSMPHLRRETAADLTDAMRALLLRACGYQVSAIEFVPSEHTRKNTLIKAMAFPPAAAAERARAAADYRALVAATGGVGLGLAARLPIPT